MIQERVLDGEPILSVETIEEFYQALATGKPVHLPWDLAQSLGCPDPCEEPVDDPQRVMAATHDPWEL